MKDPTIPDGSIYLQESECDEIGSDEEEVDLLLHSEKQLLQLYNHSTSQKEIIYVDLPYKCPLFTCN